MAREKKQDEGKKGAPEYMLTYGDMMTLLLCFFVLLLAMAEIDPAKFKMAASSFQNAFNGVLETMPTVAIHKEILIPRLGGDEQNKKIAMQAAREIKEVAKKENLDEAVKVNVTDNGIAIKIADPIAFDIGKAVLKPAFSNILDGIVKVLAKIPDSEIRVEGHTDDIPINTREFPSNWELSSARALSVIKFLYRQGGINPSLLSAVGYGEFRPISSNDTPENRQKNRRIEIYVEYIEKK